jgi:hypothetical protein
LDHRAFYLVRHCEERSDAAIHHAVDGLDCRAPLAGDGVMQFFGAMFYTRNRAGGQFCRRLWRLFTHRVPAL